MDFNNSFEVYPYILLNDFLRYFLTAGLAYLAFWVLFKQVWYHRIIQRKAMKWRKMFFEFRYSLSTVLIFSFTGLAIYYMENAGYTLIYEEIEDYGWIYFFISLVLMILLHDAYFYWTHRLMHHPKLFPHIHLVHHRSTNPSPWAAYSFHPLEAVIEAGIFPLIVCCIPAHPFALLLFLSYMIIRNVQGHLGIEFLPPWFIKSKWLNWHTTTVHHDLHHKHFNSNYGLYFTWWDNWLGTTDKRYESTFLEVTNRPKRNSKKMSSVLLPPVLFLMGLSTTTPSLAQSPVGIWQTFIEGTEEPLSLIRIDETDQGLQGRVAKIFSPAWLSENPVCMACPGKFKGQKVLGMTFLWGYEPSGSYYTRGHILDPKNGEIYDSKMWLDNDTTLKVRGYGGPFNLFYRTQSWNLQHPGEDDNPFTGIWIAIDDHSNKPAAKVEIIESEGRLTGKIVKIFLQEWEGEDPTCPYCPGEQKGKKIVGMTILWNFKKNDDHWANGKILDPGNGKVYNSSMWLETENLLRVRGYWGPFYRTQQWKRVY